MVTGSIWEKEVFGRWLFAGPFFWEDVVSMLVIALHTAYLVALFTGWLDPRSSRCSSRSRPMPPTSSTPRSSSEAAGGTARLGAGRRAAGNLEPAR